MIEFMEAFSFLSLPRNGKIVPDQSAWMTRPSTRKTPFSQKDRDVKRRHERRFRKYLRRSESLKKLYREPEISNHSIQIEDLLFQTYVYGMAVGAHLALDQMKL